MEKKIFSDKDALAPLKVGKSGISTYNTNRLRLCNSMQGLFTTPSCQQSKCLDDSEKVKTQTIPFRLLYYLPNFKIQSQNNEENAEKILFCCCNEKNCNNDYAWEPGTVGGEDGEAADDPEDSSDDDREAGDRQEELIILVIMGATVLCGVTVLAAVMLLVIHSIRSRSVSWVSLMAWVPLIGQHRLNSVL